MRSALWLSVHDVLEGKKLVKQRFLTSHSVPGREGRLLCLVNFHLACKRQIQWPTFPGSGNHPFLCPPEPWGHASLIWPHVCCSPLSMPPSHDAVCQHVFAITFIIFLPQSCHMRFIAARVVFPVPSASGVECMLRVTAACVWQVAPALLLGGTTRWLCVHTHVVYHSVPVVSPGFENH